MAEPEINVDRRWWKLEADRSAVTAAARAWRSIGTAAEDAGDDLNTKATVVYDGGWEGEGRDGYQDHQRKLSTSLVKASEPAIAVADALDDAAEALRIRQDELTTAEGEITGAVPCTVGADTITFKPEDAKQSTAVHGAVTTAKGIRKQLDTDLSTVAAALDTATTAFTKTSDDWDSIVAGTDPFNLPPEASGTRTITLTDGTVLLNSGTGDDDVKVTTDEDGNVVVTVNGQTHTYPPGTDITVRGGEGDDTITVDTDDVKVTALGGEGEDTISTGNPLLPFFDSEGGDHTILAGDGDDSVSTGEGNNRVSGGSGNDSVLAGDGDDQISTGDGQDSVLDFGGDNMISTGRGNDSVSATGTNSVYSGSGEDKVSTEGGDDTIVAGDGDDRIEAGDGNDRVYSGEGMDYVDGQDGDDYLDGGTADPNGQGDTIYGGDGDDRMVGTDGDDYMDGGEGDDSLLGRDGNDVLSGGNGDDAIDAGAGDDVIYTGFGEDDVRGDSGDTAYYQDGEDRVQGVGTKEDVKPVDVNKLVEDGVIEIDGDEEFTDRMLADLNTFGASPTGKEMLGLYEDHMTDFMNGDSLKITELQLDPDNPDRDEEGEVENGYARNTGTFSDDIELEINPAFHLGDGPGGRPAVVLYHELAHGASHLLDVHTGGDKVGGNGPDADINKSERLAAGLKTDGSAYDPNDPSGGLGQDYDLTENGIRDEMGLDPRETYSSDGR
ncbi:M91 family zinc metallopeptidase [Stackebrandtia soli]|uniref:M91 family zinc metallopeptidase n=1 Tax=Stackebrandtia soli TaxID=1892856 RepID=UPI0039EAC579